MLSHQAKRPATNMVGGSLDRTAPSTLPEGARINSDVYPVNPHPFAFDSSVSTSELIEINAVSDPITTSTIQYQIQPTNTPGLMYDFKNSIMEISYTNSSTDSKSFWYTTYVGALMWDSVDLTLNGTRISDSENGLQSFGHLAKLQLTKPYTTQGGVMSEENDASEPSHDILYTCEASPNATYDAHMGCWRCNPPSKRIFERRTKSGMLQPQFTHPILEQDKYLPANMTIGLSFHKAGGAANWLKSAIQTIDGEAQYAPTVTSVKYYLRRVQLTNTGLQLYNSLLSAVGKLTYPVVRTQCLQQVMAKGSANLVFNAIFTRKPRAVCITIVPTSYMQRDAYTNPHPLGLQSDGTTNLQLAELYVRSAGRKYPENYNVTRAAATYNVGGSSILDYEQYKKLCFHDKDCFLTAATYETATQQYWINLTDSQSPIEGLQQPVAETGQVEISLRAHTGVAQDTTVVVTAVYNDIVSIEPRTGRVGLSW